MFEVITPATSTALTTISRAREVLGFGSGDDRAATVLIDQVSRAIADYCRRPFGIEALRETFDDRDLYDAGPLLSRSPVVEITSVRAAHAALLPAEYRLDRQRNRLQVIDAAGLPVPWWGGGLTVEYRAGYVLPGDAEGDNAPAVTLPTSVERAAIILLSTALAGRSRDPGVKQESTEGVGSTTWYVAGPGDALASPEAQQLLAPFIRYYP
jgi:hypothetical protein